VSNDAAAHDVMVQWVPVEQRKPPVQRMVILHTPTSQRGIVDYGFCSYEDHEFYVQSMLGWERVSNFGSEVLHWMALPGPPRSKDAAAAPATTDALSTQEAVSK
jgi:hypothetical protein